MENSPIIRDYVELCEQIEKEEGNFAYSEEIYLETLWDYEDKGLMDETNDIFLYAGTFMTDFAVEKRVDRDSIYGEFDRYINIESFDEILNPVEDREVFETKHKIIFSDVLEPTKYMLYEIRDEFINDSLSEGQEIACKKILSRYKKN